MKILDGFVNTCQSEKGTMALITLFVSSWLTFSGHLDSDAFKWVVLGTVGCLFTAHTASDIFGGNDSNKGQ